MRRRQALAWLGAGLPSLAIAGRPGLGALAAVRGEWQGTLSYSDLASPGRIARLPVRLQVTLPAPDELALHFIHDDLAGRPVESDERLRVDRADGTLVWSLGALPRGTRVSVEFSADRLNIGMDEIDATGRWVGRNRYTFSRPA